MQITYTPGTNMLKMFKDSPLKTSILDDFVFYEERQKVMQEEKSRFTGRSYDTYIPAIVSANKPSDSAEQNDSANQIAKEDGGQSSVTSDQPSKPDGEQDLGCLLTTEAVPAGQNDQQVTSKPDAVQPSEYKGDVDPYQKGDVNVASSVTKMKSLAIGSEEDNKEAAAMEKGTQADVVTVGSMHIKVNGTAGATSNANAATIRSIPVEPKSVKLENKGATFEGSSSPK